MSKKKTSLLTLPLFLLWPFGAFLVALRNIQSKISAIVIILFSTVFGYAFHFRDTSADSYRLAWVFNEFRADTVEEAYLLYLAGGTPDIYRPLSFAFIGVFTNNPKVLYALFGFVFGVFWYYSLRIFTREQQGIKNIFIFILFIVFLATNPITNINGFRFNTAVWVYFYAMYNYLKCSKNKWLVMIFFTPLIHYSFLFTILVTLLFVVSKKILYDSKRINSLLFYFFIFSFCVSWFLELNIVRLDMLTQILPAENSISDKINIYSSDEMVSLYSERASTSTFLKVSNFFGTLQKIYFFVATLFLWFFIKKLKKPKLELNKRFSFTLLLISLCTLVSGLPSVGRFLIIPYIFIIILMLELFVKYPTPKIKKYILGLLPVFSFQILFSMGLLSYLLVSKTIWFGNVFWIIAEGIGYEFVYLE